MKTPETSLSAARLDVRVLADGVADRRVPWHGAAVLLILVLAVWFRLSHLGDQSLTHDEAWRANVAYLDIETIVTPRRLPPLQFAIGWLVQHSWGRTELAVRLPYALAGLGCVVLAYGFARRHLNRETAVLTAAVVATHPALVMYSRRAKVFSLETMVSVAVLWAGYEAYQRRSVQALLVFMAIALVGLGLTFTASLMIVAWMPLLLAALWPLRTNDRRLWRCFVVVGLVLAVAGGVWYVWLAGAPNRDMVVGYQGESVGSWVEAYTPAAVASWLANKSYGTLQFVLGMPPVWSPLKWVVGTAGLLALCASIGPLWKRCRPLCVYAGVLGLAVVGAGLMRFWPIGDRPTMLFAVPLFAIAIGCGLQHFIARMGRSAAVAVILLFCVLVPAARATKATLSPAPFEQHLRPVFAHTATNIKPGEALFIHYEARDAYGFYWRPGEYPTRLQPFDSRDDLGAFASQFDPWIAEHGRVWFVLMMRRPQETGPWMDHLRTNYKIVDEFLAGDTGTYLIELKR